jgi:hypothetical protein
MLVPRLIYNGVTYDISQTRFEATRELLRKLVEGQCMGVVMSLTRDGSWHHLFLTPGAPVTLIE